MNTTVTRSISGIVFLAVMIGCLLGGRYCFTALFLFIQGVMMQEFYRITMGDRHKGVRIAAIASPFAFWLVDPKRPQAPSVKWIQAFSPAAGCDDHGW